MTLLTDKRAALVEAHRCMLDCARVGNTQAAAEWGLRLVDLTLDMSEARTIAMLDAREAEQKGVLGEPDSADEAPCPRAEIGQQATGAAAVTDCGISPPTPEGEAGAEGPDDDVWLNVYPDREKTCVHPTEEWARNDMAPNAGGRTVRYTPASRLTACEAKLREAEARVAELERRATRDAAIDSENADLRATIDKLTRERDEARARQATLAATADRMTEAAREAIVTRQSAERERDEALAALRESEASHEDPVWEELRALAHDALSIEAKLSAQPPTTPARLDESTDNNPHIVDGEFQSDKYPTCPRGKVPMSTKDPAAQDLLWTYAQRRRAGSHGSREVDASFADAVERSVQKHGLVPPARLDESRTAEPKTRLVGHAHAGDRIGPGTVVADTHVDNETGKRTGLGVEKVGDFGHCADTTSGCFSNATWPECSCTCLTCGPYPGCPEPAKATRYCPSCLHPWHVGTCPIPLHPGTPADLTTAGCCRCVTPAHEPAEATERRWGTYNLDKRKFDGRMPLTEDQARGLCTFANNGGGNYEARPLPETEET